MKKQQGFTLVELVVVVAILGLLAAFAIPRYISLESKARSSMLNGLAGAIRSSDALVYALATANGTAANTTGTVSAQGHTVNTAYGYPTSTTGGIDVAVQYDTSAYSFTSGTPGSFTIAGYSGPNCSITYTPATDANTPPVVQVTTTGC